MRVGEEWQRLSPLALVFLILSGLQRQVRENLFLFAGAGAGAAFTDWLGLRELLLIGLALVLFSVLGAIIYHRRFRFRLEDDALRVRRGLIEHKELRLRFARVQNIQLAQPFYFRPFGLVRFSLQTPGAADKEVELPGIGRELAETMRDRISAARMAPAALVSETVMEAGPDSSEPDLELFAPGPGRLLLHGLSSNQVWVIAGVFFYLLGNFGERFGERLERAAEEALDKGLALDPSGAGWLLVAGAVLGFVLLLFALSGLLALVRFWRFRLRRRDDRLVMVAGLFDRREQTVRDGKITGLTLRQSVVGRLLGCWSLVLRQARSGDHEVGGRGNAVEVPGLSRSDLALADKLVPGAGLPACFEGISPYFRRYAFSRLLLGLLVSLVVFGMLFGFDHWSVLVVACAAVLALPAIHLRFRHWGWALCGQVLWLRRGWLGQRIDGFDLARVQQARVTSSPYLRRHQLVGLELLPPQGSVRLPFVAEAVAARLANLALAVAEQARDHRV
ncbi:MAG: PH domain-containing protein [Wenzhouxiangella sp.]